MLFWDVFRVRAEKSTICVLVILGALTMVFSLQSLSSKLLYVIETGPLQSGTEKMNFTVGPTPVNLSVFTNNV